MVVVMVATQITGVRVVVVTIVVLPYPGTRYGTGERAEARGSQRTHESVNSVVLIYGMV